jgi:hypothetical protein
MGRFRLLIATAGVVLIGTVASAQNASVTGRVTNAQGGVIPNADVTLRALPAPGSPPMPNMPNMPGMNERTAKSGADGAFTFDQVAAGAYVLQADAPGFERSSQAITVTNGTQTFAMTLDPLEVPGGEEIAKPAGEALDTQALLARIRATSTTSRSRAPRSR